MLADITGFVQEGLTSWWAPVLAFAAGVVSFASPCVFPLVPGYLSFVTGTQLETSRETSKDEKRSLLPVVLFIGGFAFVFTLLGAFSSVFVPVMKSAWGLRIAGIVVIIFGAAMIIYALRVGKPGLYAERRPFLSKVKPGPAGAFPLGMAFAAGWTPCIGPVLGGILLVAGAEGGSVRGAGLLFAYSMGLGVPFLLVALGMGWLMGKLSWVQRHYRAIAGVSGGVMVAIGLLLLSGYWLRMLSPVLQWVQRFETPL